MTDTEQKRIFAKNLNRYIAGANKTQVEIANAIGVSPQTLNTWVKGIAIPRMGAVQKLADYFHIKKSELIDEQPSQQPRKFLRIPVLGAVPAGIPIEAIEDIIDWEDISLNDFDPSFQYFGLRVQGDSMIPKYIEGDTIIVKVQADCESGEDAVVYVNGYDATLKKVFKQPFGIMLQPLNPEYEPIFYDYSDETHPVNIVGVVVEIRRKV